MKRSDNDVQQKDALLDQIIGEAVELPGGTVSSTTGISLPPQYLSHLSSTAMQQIILF